MNRRPPSPQNASRLNGGLVYRDSPELSNRTRKWTLHLREAEGVGFEPTEHFCSRVFETRALDRTMLPLRAKNYSSTEEIIPQTEKGL
jgi:hypothetical protein